MKNQYRMLTVVWALLMAGTVPCAAQDVTVIMQELADLREELVILQRKSYNGENSELEVRVGRLDEVIRSASGRMDELEYKIKQLNEKLDLVNKDIDVRMKLLEGKKITGSGTAAVVDNSPKFAAPVAQNAPSAIVGGAISRGDNLEPIKMPTPAEIYQKGLEALKATDYAAAEENFNKILSKHPKDKLAGNAQYWLGETYYARKEFDRAAVSFAKGYQNYKESPKRADSLLKLGMSMQSLNKKDEACAAFVSLPTEFPKADKTLKNKAAEGAKKLGCK